MPRLVCFIYTQTNGLHNSNEFVSKKNMFEFARSSGPRTTRGPQQLDRCRGKNDPVGLISVRSDFTENRP